MPFWGAIFAFAIAASAGNAFSQTFTCVLQADLLAPTKPLAVQLLAACDRDWVVVDPSYSQGTAWSPQEIQHIRAARPGRLVLAYLSIGEAETYRDYWHPTWDANADGKPDPAAPAWLLPENPHWKNNYPVAYWHPAWQKIILSRLTDILTTGFDGAYLDIVDAFQTFEYDPAQELCRPHLINPNTGNTYREDMIHWIEKIATSARAHSPDFLIVPQNGDQLTANPRFLSTLSALAVESTLTTHNSPNPAEQVASRQSCLKRVQAARKPVLLIEYPTLPKLKSAATTFAKTNNYSLLLTHPSLSHLGTSPTLHAPRP
jgi:cysteinyl-tRNA synthetase